MRPRSVTRFALGGLGLALWLVTSAFAASPQLHGLLHQDAQDPNHYCLFTQLNQHSLLAAPTTIAAPEPPQCASDAIFPSVSIFLPSFDYVVNYGRGPPSLSPFTAVVG